MSGSPEVSVVMSVYNAASSLAATVDSILSQDGVELEFIVVNDGSIDETGKILDDYARCDPRVRVIHQENTGLTRALIRGCGAARGEFIARQDAGDLALGGRLAAQRDVLRNDPRTVMTACGARYIGPGSEFLYEVCQYGDELQAGLMHVDVARFYGPSHHSSVMFRREAYERVGGYRAHLEVAQDLDLWIRLAELGMCWAMPEVLCEVSKGWRDTEITVCVQDVRGWRQFMQVTPTMVNDYDGQPYLPVGLIQVDHKARKALIELPTEADSGVNRMWLPFESFLREAVGEPEPGPPVGSRD